MAEILHFTPRHELKTQGNLKEFIRFCREDLSVFGTDLDWESNQWSSAGVTFGNLDQKTRILKSENTMKMPFLDFAKAYFRYSQGLKPTGAKTEMRALKCIERALIDQTGGASISDVNLAVFDQAAMICKKHYSPSLAYVIGLQLEGLARFLSEKKLISGLLDWKNLNPRMDKSNRTGKKAQKLREKRLPNEAPLNALADIFAGNPTNPRDIFTSSVVALLMCVPSRVSEVLALHVDCEVKEVKRNGELAYGLRFQPAKGAQPQIKWVPEPMVGLAKEAIARVKKLTEEARKIAVWYETSPDLFYRHVDCPDELEFAPLTAVQACQAVGIGYYPKKMAKTGLRQVKLPVNDGENTLHSLNQWVTEKLPKEFPWFDMERRVKYSQALFCMQRHLLRPDITTSPVQIVKPHANWINSDLETSKTLTGYLQKSIFDRNGFSGEGGGSLKVTSHQFRHLLNTMAQRGGLSQVEVARWSGRANMKQNRDYDHMDEYELVDMLRVHDDSLELYGSLEELREQIVTKLPMKRQEINLLMMPTAHITEYGFCVHDFTMAPCQKHLDCLNCTEQVCVKGDKRLEGVRFIYEKNKELLAKANQEIADGSAGADRWYEHLLQTKERAKELIAILENPEIKNGAIIKLKNSEEFSPLRRAVEAKMQKKIDNEQQEILEDMRDLLGGG